MRAETLRPAAEVVRRLERAITAHDLDALVACFASDYRNETPAHPERSFTGREQVRRNWEQILALVPDITATVIRYVVDGEDVWSEWEHRGSRRDGSEHLMRGVIIFRVVNDAVASARFYIEPVQAGGGDVEAAVRRQVMAPPSTPPPAPRS